MHVPWLVHGQSYVIMSSVNNEDHCIIRRSHFGPHRICSLSIPRARAQPIEKPSAIAIAKFTVHATMQEARYPQVQTKPNRSCLHTVRETSSTYAFFRLILTRRSSDKTVLGHSAVAHCCAPLGIARKWYLVQEAIDTPHARPTLGELSFVCPLQLGMTRKWSRIHEKW